MGIEETLSFIHEKCWKGSRLGLSRITELLHRMRDPHKQLKYVHIAGTNGKGSTAAMMASILQRAGYRVGLYTSPYLSRFNERMQINGVSISDDALIALTAEASRHVEAMQDRPTEFELITALAFRYFQQECCDIVVLEVGLGGRLDSTNVIPAPEVAVITHIALDHTEILGETLEKIAVEKAGIIKASTPAVVLYEQSEVVEAVIRNRCGEANASLTITERSALRVVSASLSGQMLCYRERTDLALSLLGTYQAENAAVVLDTADALRHLGWQISEQAIRDGLQSAAWPGRFEVLSLRPVVILDGAHNPDGIRALTNGLTQYLPKQPITFLVGLMADKDYPKMLRILVPFAKRFVTVTPDNKRALPSAELQKSLQRVFHGEVLDGGSVINGLALLHDTTEKDDIVCICGSLYMAGEVRESILQRGV